MEEGNRGGDQNVQFWRFYERSNVRFEQIETRVKELQVAQAALQSSLAAEIQRGMAGVQQQVSQNIEVALLKSESRLQKQITDSVTPLTTWKTYVLGGAAVILAVGTVLGPIILPWLAALFKAAPGAGK
jgi:hypothetical protein